METLRNEGLIVARQGSGFFVTEVPIGRLAGNRGRATTRLMGGLAFRRLGDPVRAAAAPRIAEQLGVDADTPVLHRARLMLLEDGTPASCVTAYFPPDIAEAAPLLSGTAALPGGTTRHIASATGRTPTRGIDILTARLASNEEAELLNVDLPAAVQVTLHTAYDAAGSALVCEEGVSPAHLAEHVDEYPMGGLS
jgi:DNA-binding GntR family transcriptional regulator